MCMLPPVRLRPFSSPTSWCFMILSPMILSPPRQPPVTALVTAVPSLTGGDLPGSGCLRLQSDLLPQSLAKWEMLDSQCSMFRSPDFGLPSVPRPSDFGPSRSLGVTSLFPPGAPARHNPHSKDSLAGKARAVPWSPTVFGVGR